MRPIVIVVIIIVIGEVDLDFHCGGIIAQSFFERLEREKGKNWRGRICA